MAGAALVTALTLASCGSSSTAANSSAGSATNNSSTTNNSSAATTSSASSTGSAPSAAGGGGKGNSGAGVKFGMVGLYNAPYPNALAAGAKMAAGDDGADFTQLGPAGLDPNTAIADFQNGVAAGMKGILVMAYPGDLWRTPINRGAAGGVTVATADVYSENSKAITEVGAPKVAMGAALADAYLKQIPEGASGTIVPALCVAGLNALVAPLQGFKLRIQEKRPNVKVVDPEVTAGDPAGDFAAWQRITAKYPKALGFVGACDIDVPNLIKVKQSTPGATYLIGSTAGGDDPVVAKAVSGGVMVGVVTQRSWLEGYVGMKLIINHVLRGAAMPNGWINTGFDIVTKDNVGDIVKVLQDPAVARQRYSTLAANLVKNAASIARLPVTYQYDNKSINEPNPQP